MNLEGLVYRIFNIISKRINNSFQIYRAKPIVYYKFIGLMVRFDTFGKYIEDELNDRLL